MADDTRRGRLPRVVRALLIALLAAAVLVLLFGWVFPWVEENIYNPSLDASGEYVKMADSATGPGLV